MDLRLMILKKFGPQGYVCPHPGAIYMYITAIFKDLCVVNKPCMCAHVVQYRDHKVHKTGKEI